MRTVLLVFCAFLSLFVKAEVNANWKAKTEQAGYIHRAIKKMTDVMVHDIYSPPVASRTYAYITLAGYEAGLHGNTAYQSIAGQVRGLKGMPKPKKGEEY